MPMPLATPVDAARVSELRPAGDPADPSTTARWVRSLLEQGLLDLPFPGGGRTDERLAALAQIAQVDLDVARLVEAHTDAQAIVLEVIGRDADVHLGLTDMDTATDTDTATHTGTGTGTGTGTDTDTGTTRLWGVWAANPPTAPVTATQSPQGWRLEGTKPWCSGAGCCDAALVTAQAPDGYRLFAVRLDDPSVHAVDGTWPARSMRGSDSRSVCFVSTPAVPVGGVDAYLSRPGFWHGAVGVAATWLGGAYGVADPLWQAAHRRPLHPHALAHAGGIDAALAAGQAVLDLAAHAIDADPVNSTGEAELTARRVRAVIERVAAEVVERVGRALGAAPLALNAEHAKRVGDLELYLRQSHAERDLEALGNLVVERGSAT
jgi:alkylation response protein AidB-like acyl-CoA dehydrogenase